MAKVELHIRVLLALQQTHGFQLSKLRVDFGLEIGPSRLEVMEMYIMSMNSFQRLRYIDAITL